MANLYVASTGSNTAPYDTWAKAATTPLTATAAAATNDTIYQHAETFTVTVDTTYTLAGGVRWICTNDKTNEPPQTLSTSGAIVSTTNSVDIYVACPRAYIYGLRFSCGGTTGTILGLAINNLNILTAENCKFEIANNNTASDVQLGPSATSSTAELTFINCSVKFAGSGQSILLAGRATFVGGTYPDSAGTVPFELFKTNQSARLLTFNGVDLSGMTSGTVFTPSDHPTNFVLSGCKLGAATLNTAISVQHGPEYYLYDCSSADAHYQFAHYALRGSTTVSTSIYCNDGAEYDSAGNKASWVVAGNTYAGAAKAYRSPWFSRYNEATSAITPELEILRDGSSTAFTDIEVWSEWMLKTVGGSPLATLYSDYGGHLATGAAQGNGVGLAGWTGESGTAWSGKLECPSVTPAEIGHISARVVVAGNYTVYVDPRIRGT